MTGLHIIATPTGRFIFVGRVPSALAFTADSAPDLVEIACQSGPGIAARIAKREGRPFGTLSFATEAEALAARAAWEAANLA